MHSGVSDFALNGLSDGGLVNAQCALGSHHSAPARPPAPPVRAPAALYLLTAPFTPPLPPRRSSRSRHRSLAPSCRRASYKQRQSPPHWGAAKLVDVVDDLELDLLGPGILFDNIHAQSGLGERSGVSYGPMQPCGPMVRRREIAYRPRGL